MIIQVIAAFAAIFTFAMALEIPKKYLINCGFIGAAGWFVYLVVLQRFGMMTANLLGAAAITLLAHFFARIKKAPVTIFLIPGFLTLVPGAGLYRSVHYFFIGNRSMGAAYLVQTLQIVLFTIDDVKRFVIYGRFPCGDHWKKKTKRREKQSESGKKIAGAAWDCTCIIEKR